MKQIMIETETETKTPQLKIMGNFINYIIYSNGKIYNCKKDCFCKTERKDKNRYQEVRLIDNQGYSHIFYVHFLVASNFIGEIPEGMQVNHINEDKHDNRVENLEIVTPAQNCAHGTRNERIAKTLKGKIKQHHCFQVEDLNNPDEVEVFDCLASFLK